MKKPKEVKNELATNIIKLRNMYDLSAKQFAAKINRSGVIKVHSQTVCDWEAGRIEPPLWQLNEVCKCFDISMDTIYNSKL